MWCFHLIVLLRNMQEIAKELHACFFRSAKTRVLNKAWLPVRRSRFLKAGFDELTITKITRKVNAPNIRRIDNQENYTQSQCAQYYTVKKRAHSDCQFVECTRSSKWQSCLFNMRVYGENYEFPYGKFLFLRDNDLPPFSFKLLFSGWLAKISKHNKNKKSFYVPLCSSQIILSKRLRLRLHP